MSPLSLLSATTILGAIVISSLDPLTSGLVIAVAVVTMTVLRLAPRRALGATAALIVVAALTGMTTLLYGRPSGATFWTWGAINVTQGSADLALAVALRVLALGLTGVALLSRITPQSLADALGQVWRVPARFVVGALASMRGIDELREDWRMLAMARRARGLTNPSQFPGVVVSLPAMSLALMIRALRRANMLATAMESRGLGALPHRTWAVESRWRAVDWVVVAGALLLGSAIVTTSVLTGQWSAVLV